jgi:hypothetical protein
MGQVKRNQTRMNIVIDPLLYDLLNHMAEDMVHQPKSSIIESYLSRGVVDWYERNEPESPSFLEYKKELRKREI